MAKSEIRDQRSEIREPIRHTSYVIRRRDPRGFTLLELVIGIGITIIIVFVLDAVFQETFVSLQRETARQALFDETRRAADTITETAESARAVLTSYTSNEPATYMTGSDTVIFSLPAQDTSGNLLAGVVDTIVMSRDPANPSQLVFRTFPGAGSARVAGTKRPTAQLANFAIQYFTPDSNGDGLDEPITSPAQDGTATRVEATITTSHPLRTDTLTLTLTGGGRLRNAP